MADCKTCNFENICVMPDFVRNNLKDCKVYEPKKKQTNADRIRAMSDAELAEFLYDVAITSECKICQMKQGWECEKKENESCHDGILKWLQSEVEE